MSPESSTESYPAFARSGLRENPEKNLNQVTCPDRDSNPGHLVSRPDALTVTPQHELLPRITRRIVMPKEAFNRKRSIFCGPLKKELRKRLVKCFVWIVALYGAETWTLRRIEEKRLEAFEMWIWRRMERVKWTDRIRNEAVLERVDKERMMLKLIRRRKRNWLGYWLRRNCLLKDALEGMVKSSWQKKISGDRRWIV
ncbi:hypothetical protein ANN_18652 [Periplaneta americana]|uniref:Uncharacterized protein n=1 Tax=Periplaneta americana TaxID=6978 RepID=A0ABQ8SQK2_PERAM|nr:hypothetical protein ANN_18652 [Periplaneta americana]